MLPGYIWFLYVYKYCYILNYKHCITHMICIYNKAYSRYSQITINFNLVDSGVIKVCCEIQLKTSFSLFNVFLYFSGTIFNLIWTYFDRNVSYRGRKLYYKSKIHPVYLYSETLSLKTCHFLFISKNFTSIS